MPGGILLKEKLPLSPDKVLYICVLSLAKDNIISDFCTGLRDMESSTLPSREKL